MRPFLVRRMMTRREAWESMRISETTLDLLVAFGEIECRRIGRRVLIPADAVDEFLRRSHGGRRAA